jgi:hypothetical protein
MQEGYHHQKSNQFEYIPKIDVFDEEFLSQLEDMNTIADYFCVIGIDENSLASLIN